SPPAVLPLAASDQVETLASLRSGGVIVGPLQSPQDARRFQDGGNLSLPQPCVGPRHGPFVLPLVCLPQCAPGQDRRQGRSVRDRRTDEAVRIGLPAAVALLLRGDHCSRAKQRLAFLHNSCLDSGGQGGRELARGKRLVIEPLVAAGTLPAR